MRDLGLMERQLNDIKRYIIHLWGRPRNAATNIFSHLIDQMRKDKLDDRSPKVLKCDFLDHIFWYSMKDFGLMERQPNDM